jgi:ELWxxDGT repeat protein
MMGVSGTELWVSDGSTAGTRLLVDIEPGSASGASFAHRARMGGKVWFTGRTSTHGAELWFTDGSAAGTGRLTDLNPGSGDANPRYLQEVGGKLWFSASNSSSDWEPYVTDGSAAGTVSLGDLRAGSSASYARDFAPVVGGRVVFSAWVSQSVFDSGYELCISDGTPAGTGRLVDINPGSNASAPSFISPLSNGLVIFAADNGANGSEPWVSDGTSAGTQLLANLEPEGGTSKSSYANEFVPFFGHTMFAANDGLVGTELWYSDGTRAGTRLVRDLLPGPNGSSPRGLTRLGRHVLFSAQDLALGNELWISDGSAAGTRLLKDIQVGTSSSLPQHFVRIADRIYFSANDGSNGRELWISDGTTQGTRLLADIQAGASGSFPANLTVQHERLYFKADDGVRGSELWRTDGTAQGTQLFFEVRPGPNDGFPFYLSAIGSRYLYFSANDVSFGSEVWRTDGTVAGTTRLTDLQNGFASSTPQSSSENDRSVMIPLAGHVLVQMNGANEGHEPYLIPNGATATPVGEGYTQPGAARPQMRSDDPILGSSFKIYGSNVGQGGRIGVILCGIPSTQPLRVGFGAFSYVDLLSYWFVLHASGLPAPTWTRPVALPNDPSFQGIQLMLQTWILPTSSPIGMDATNGLHWFVGR